MESGLEDYDFLAEFRKWEKGRILINCWHHKIDQKLAYFVDEYTKENLEPIFLYSWFGRTVSEQILHRYFFESSLKWKELFGEFPIPMRGSGMGCIAWDNPVWLIEKLVSHSKENEDIFQSYLFSWQSFTESRLKLINFPLKDFYSAILRSKHFRNRTSWAANAFWEFINDAYDSSTH